MKHIGKCERCGKESAYAYKSFIKRFCSHACSNAQKWEIRPRGEVVTYNCLTCNAGFSLLKSKAIHREKKCPIKYCSKQCEGQAKVKPESKVSIPCSGCGVALIRRAHDLGKRSFCSRKCQSMCTRTVGSTWSTYSPNRAGQRKYMRSYLAANRDTHNSKSRQWARKNRAYRNFIQIVRRASGTLSFEQYQQVFERCGNKCVVCHSVENLQVDHIVAIRRGGKTEDSNLQILCGPCNSSKGAKIFSQWLKEREMEVRS